jgi:transposase
VVESAAAVEEPKEQEQQLPDLEELWRRLEGVQSTGKRSGRRYSHERRLVLEAIVHVMQSDCGWQALPSQYPSWKTVYAQYRQWRKQGIWQKIWAQSAQPFSNDELQL